MMKIMFYDKVHSIPVDITSPSVFDLSYVRIHMTLCFSEDCFEVCSALK
jgi:hypothetical protein